LATLATQAGWLLAAAFIAAGYCRHWLLLLAAAAITTTLLANSH